MKIWPSVSYYCGPFLFLILKVLSTPYLWGAIPEDIFKACFVTLKDLRQF